jgi:hypothetical protein
MSGHYSACTFRTVGNAATAQNLLTIENRSPISIIYIKKISIVMDVTVALTAVNPLFKLNRTTDVPGGGTILQKAQWDTQQGSDSLITLRGATASDGGGATAIAATPAVPTIWQSFGTRIHTAVGQVLCQEFVLTPAFENDLLYIRNGEAMVVNIAAAVGTSNPATNHYVVNVFWEEL